MIKINMLYLHQQNKQKTKYHESNTHLYRKIRHKPETC